MKKWTKENGLKKRITSVASDRVPENTDLPAASKQTPWTSSKTSLLGWSRRESKCQIEERSKSIILLEQ
jgi:hypothetical protein